MKFYFVIGATLAVCLLSLSATARDDLRTANEVLNLVDKGLRIATPKPQPPPHTVVVPVNAGPPPVVVCAYPENSYVTPVVAPWNAVRVVSTPVVTQTQVVIAPAPQPLPPAKVRWKR